MPVYFTVILVILARVLPNTTYAAVSYFPPSPLVPATPVPIGILAFAPNTSADAAAVMDAIVARPPFQGREVLGFETDAALVDYYTATASSSAAPLAGVVFSPMPDGSLPPDVQVTLRFDLAMVPSTLVAATAPSSCRDSLDWTGCPPYLYLVSGFVGLQAALADALAGVLLNATLTAGAPGYNASAVQQYPKGEYVSTSATLSTLVAIYTVAAFAPLVQFLVVNVVYEKEHRIREHLFMMGVSSFAYLVAWCAAYAAMILITTLIMSILMVPGKILPLSNFFLIFLLLYLYGLSLIAFAFALTPFFNNAKIAGAVASLSTILVSLVFLPLTLVQPPSGDAMWAASLLSPVALALVLGQAVALEAAGIGATFSSIWDNPIAGGYSIGASLVMIFVDVVLYTTIAWYCDNVVPSEYGVKRPPYFLFTRRYWAGASTITTTKTRAATTAAVTTGDKPVADNPDVEAVDEATAPALDIDIRYGRGQAVAPATHATAPLTVAASPPPPPVMASTTLYVVAFPSCSSAPICSRARRPSWP